MNKFYGTSPTELVQQNRGSPSQNQYDAQIGGRFNQSTFDINEAYKVHFSLQKDIYPEVNKYLTTLDEPEFRGIKKEILEVYRVGVGKEKFRND